MVQQLGQMILCMFYCISHVLKRIIMHKTVVNQPIGYLVFTTVVQFFHPTFD